MPSCSEAVEYLFDCDFCWGMMTGIRGLFFFLPVLSPSSSLELLQEESCVILRKRERQRERERERERGGGGSDETRFFAGCKRYYIYLVSGMG